MNWAQRPVRPVPPPPSGANERAHYLRELAGRARLLSEAICKSEQLADKRASLDRGASRARVTSANARWATAAEHRDALERDFEAALIALIGQEQIHSPKGLSPDKQEI